MHYGIDLGAKRGTPVHASASGRVIRAEYFSSFGNFIVIDHGNDITTRYAHLQNILVRDGARVVGGQPIGLVGSTGRATGPHLHFEILVKGRQKNPQNYVKFGRTRRLPSLPSSPSSPPPQLPDVIKGEPAPGLGTGLDTGSL